MAGKTVGTRVREARKKYGPKFTQSDLAARLQTEGINIDNVMISRIENGNREVSPVELYAIAKTLKVTPNWLLDFTED
jgi:transcriptional regulator with XRE-family HTH domain